MRTHYNNGDMINLEFNGCDGCSPCMVNAAFCHEQGCPDAWRDAEPKEEEDFFDELNLFEDEQPDE
jgi:hypothetical protein